MSDRLQRLRDAAARKLAKGGRNARKVNDRLAEKDPFFTTMGLPAKPEPKTRNLKPEQPNSYGFERDEHGCEFYVLFADGTEYRFSGVKVGPCREDLRVS